jgi:cell wall-associated NlpC family hydrolase
MRSTRLPRISLALALAALVAVLLSLAGQASATPISEKKARAREIARQVAALDHRMEIVVEQYNAAHMKLDGVQAKVKENERNLKIARYNLMVAKETLRERVVALYKERPVDMLDVLLSTKSFDELLTQLDMLNRLGTSDARVLRSVKSYQGEIVQRRTALAADKKAAAALVAEIGAKKASIAHDLTQRQSMLKGVKKQIAAMEAAQAAAARAAARAAMSQTAAAPQVGSGAPAGVSHTGVVGIAQQYLGVPYVWGGASPSGFDCSGFTMYVYAQVGVGLPHNAAMQQSMVAAVSLPAPGDLVFFGYPAYHVGIYVGGGGMIHAPHTGTVVEYGSVAGASGYGRP